MLTATFAARHIQALYAECRTAEFRYAECLGTLETSNSIWLGSGQVHWSWDKTYCYDQSWLWPL